MTPHDDNDNFRESPEFAWRVDNVGRQLLFAALRYQRRIEQLVKDGGFRDLRASHFQVIRNLDTGGARVSTLAARAGITKAAIGQTLAACEALGLVRIEPDPADARAKIARFTRKGLRLLQTVRAAHEQVREEMVAAIGESRFAQLTGALAAWLDVLPRD